MAKRTGVALGWAAALLVALAAYTYGAGHGAAQPVYVDETYYDVYAFQLAQALSGQGIPQFVTVFPSAYSLLLGVIYGVWFGAGRLTGEFAGMSDFLVRFAVDRAPFIVAGRYLSAAFAVAALPGVYLAARRLYSARAGVVATVALAICYPVVFFAHVAANLTMLICLSAWTLYWVTRVWHEGTTKAYIACGVLIGAGIGTKYYPAAWFASLALAHVFANRMAGERAIGPVLVRHSGRLLAAGAIAVPVALLLFPVPVLAFDQWKAGLDNNVSYYMGGNVIENIMTALVGRAPVHEAVTAEPVSFYSNSFLVLTPVGLAWMLVSIAAGAVLRPKETLLLLLPLGLFFAYQAARGGMSLGIRQFYFALPAIWMVAAGTLDDICRRLPVRQGRRALLCGVASALLLLQPAMWAFRYLSLAGGPTTIDVARVDFLRLIPEGAVLLVDSSAAPFGETIHWRSAGLRQAGAAGVASAAREARLRAAPPFDVHMFTWTDAEADLAVGSPEQDVFVAITDYFSTGRWDPGTIRVWNNLNLRVAASRRAYLQALLARTEIVQEYRPRDLHALGPMITLLKVSR